MIPYHVGFQTQIIKRHVGLVSLKVDAQYTSYMMAAAQGTHLGIRQQAERSGGPPKTSTNRLSERSSATPRVRPSLGLTWNDTSCADRPQTPWSGGENKKMTATWTTRTTSACLNILESSQQSETKYWYMLLHPSMMAPSKNADKRFENALWHMLDYITYYDDKNKWHNETPMNRWCNFWRRTPKESRKPFHVIMTKLLHRESNPKLSSRETDEWPTELTDQMWIDVRIVMRIGPFFTSHPLLGFGLASKLGCQLKCGLESIFDKPSGDLNII